MPTILFHYINKIAITSSPYSLMSEEEEQQRQRGGSFNFTDTTAASATNKPKEDNTISINPDTRLSTYARPEVRAMNNKNAPPSPPKNSVVLKEIKYFNQLNSVEKMKCQTALQQGIIRGYSVPDLPLFIKVKTKLLLSIPVIQQLIKNQKAEDKQWYYHMARDNIAYVSAYRKAITSIEEYQREIWLLTISEKSDPNTKLNCYKELHALTKTLILLLRDLPFVTQLSKYYDIDKITDEYINSRRKELEKEPIESKVESNRLGFNPIRRLANQRRNLASKADSGLYVQQHQQQQQYIENDEALKSRGEFDSLNVNLAYKILEDVKKNKIYHKGEDNTNPNRLDPAKVTDEVMEDMQRQMGTVYTENEKEFNKDSIRKLTEQAAVEHHLSKIEDEIDSLGGIENIPNNEKLKEILNKYENSLSFLDAFMTEEQRNSIRNIRQLKEDK